MSLLITIAVAVLIACAIIAVWFGMRAQSSAPPSREQDTAWNDPVSPGDEATRPTND